MAAEIAKLDPADARNLGTFMSENRGKLEAFRPVLERAFESPLDLVKWDMIRAIPKLRPWATVDRTSRATSATRGCGSPSPSRRNTWG
jgi:phytoene desaturase